MVVVNGLEVVNNDLIKIFIFVTSVFYFKDGHICTQKPSEVPD